MQTKTTTQGRNVSVSTILCALMLGGMMWATPAHSEEEPDEAGEAADEAPSGAWQVMAGVGANLEPDYEGSDAYELSPIPLVIISWKGVVTLGPDKLAVSLPEWGRISSGVLLGYNEGRDEDDSDDLDGLGDIDPAAQLGLELSVFLGELGPFSTNLNAEALQDLGGSDGLTLELGPTFAHQLLPTLGIELGASALWADSRHMEDYFGISANQAASSGLGGFDADAGFKRINLTAGAQWQPSEHWMVIGEAGLGHLIGDAADSPISEINLQGSLFGGIAYVF